MKTLLGLVDALTVAPFAHAADILSSIIAAGLRTRGCAVLAALPDPSGH
ncbi:MAG: hypothetical protein ACJ79O_00190 [Myxococcales bacterium]|jgi:hypothetical protein